MSVVASGRCPTWAYRWSPTLQAGAGGCWPLLRRPLLSPALSIPTCLMLWARSLPVTPIVPSLEVGVNIPSFFICLFYRGSGVFPAYIGAVCPCYSFSWAYSGRWWWSDIFGGSALWGCDLVEEVWPVPTYLSSWLACVYVILIHSLEGILGVGRHFTHLGRLRHPSLDIYSVICELSLLFDTHLIQICSGIVKRRWTIPYCVTGRYLIWSCGRCLLFPEWRNDVSILSPYCFPFTIILFHSTPLIDRRRREERKVTRKPSFGKTAHTFVACVPCAHGPDNTAGGMQYTWLWRLWEKRKSLHIFYLCDMVFEEGRGHVPVFLQWHFLVQKEMEMVWEEPLFWLWPCTAASDTWKKPVEKPCDHANEAIDSEKLTDSHLAGVAGGKCRKSQYRKTHMCWPVDRLLFVWAGLCPQSVCAIILPDRPGQWLPALNQWKSQLFSWTTDGDDRRDVTLLILLSIDDAATISLSINLLLALYDVIQHSPGGVWKKKDRRAVLMMVMSHSAFPYYLLSLGGRWPDIQCVYYFIIVFNSPLPHIFHFPWRGGQPLWRRDRHAALQLSGYPLSLMTSILLVPFPAPLLFLTLPGDYAFPGDVFPGILLLFWPGEPSSPSPLLIALSWCPSQPGLGSSLNYCDQSGVLLPCPSPKLSRQTVLPWKENEQFSPMEPSHTTLTFSPYHTYHHVFPLQPYWCGWTCLSLSPLEAVMMCWCAFPFPGHPTEPSTVGVFSFLTLLEVVVGIPVGLGCPGGAPDISCCAPFPFWPYLYLPLLEAFPFEWNCRLSYLVVSDCRWSMPPETLACGGGAPGPKHCTAHTPLEYLCPLCLPCCVADPFCWPHGARRHSQPHHHTEHITDLEWTTDREPHLGLSCAVVLEPHIWSDLGGATVDVTASFPGNMFPYPHPSMLHTWAMLMPQPLIPFPCWEIIPSWRWPPPSWNSGAFPPPCDLYSFFVTYLDIRPHLGGRLGAFWCYVYSHAFPLFLLYFQCFWILPPMMQAFPTTSFPMEADPASSRWQSHLPLVALTCSCASVTLLHCADQVSFRWRTFYCCDRPLQWHSLVWAHLEPCLLGSLYACWAVVMMMACVWYSVF